MSKVLTGRPSGVVSARTVGVARILRRHAESARAEAKRQDAINSHLAAAMRGRARAFTDAADLVERLERGRPLNGKREKRYAPKATV